MENNLPRCSSENKSHISHEKSELIIWLMVWLRVLGIFWLCYEHRRRDVHVQILVNKNTVYGYTCIKINTNEYMQRDIYDGVREIMHTVYALFIEQSFHTFDPVLVVYFSVPRGGRVCVRVRLRYWERSFKLGHVIAV